MKFKYITALMIVLSACSAEEDLPVQDASAYRRVSICCRAGDEDPKSEYEGENRDSPVHRVLFMAYTSGKLDAQCSSSGNKANLSLYENKIYDIYALVNTGSDEFTAPQNEDDLTNMGIDSSTEGLTLRGGIPMAGNTCILVQTDATVRIPCRRLFARYRISLTGSGADCFEASEIRITGVSDKVFPFGDNRAATVTDGDSATTRDLLDFNSGREIVFHIPENLQGSNKGPLCTGVHISGRVHGYDGGGTAVYGYDRKISYDYLLKDSDGQYNVDGNSDYTSALQLNRYGWTLFDGQATLEEGSECMHYLFFCDAEGKPIHDADIRANAGNGIFRLYYRTDCDNIVIDADKDPDTARIRLLQSAIHCGADIYCNEYKNSYEDRRGDSHICFTARHAEDGFELKSAVNCRLEGWAADMDMVCDKNPDELYIAQIAALSINGAADNDWQWRVDAPGSAVIAAKGKSCMVECHGAGQVHVSATNRNGQEVSRTLTILKPAISFTRSSLTLPLDGTGADIPYRYVNIHGNPMKEDLFDDHLRESLLAPNFVLHHAISGREFYSYDDKQLFVSTLVSHGTSITTLDSGDGSAHLGQIAHPESATLANASKYGCDGGTMEIYTIVPEEEYSREFEMTNYYHIGGAVSNICPEDMYIPYADDLGIVIKSDLGADFSIDGDYVRIGWPMNYDLCGKYTVELYSKNFHDGSKISVCRVNILATMYLGIRMVSVNKDGMWWLAPVSYDNSTGLFPVDTELVSWNRDSEYYDNIEIMSSERKWGLHRNQVDGGLCISACEQYFGTVRPALSNNVIVNCSNYYFTMGSERRSLSEAYEIMDCVPGDDYVKIIDMTKN